MRIVAVNTFMSLDGVMQARGGPEEDPGSTEFDEASEAQIERRHGLA
jgi:hypothetical protein